jgi:hypothetical protein
MASNKHKTQIAANPPHMPSDVTGRVGFFDLFATLAAQFASRAWFFAGCVVVVVIWAPTTWSSAASTPGNCSSTH